MMISELFSKSNDGQIQQNGLIISTDEVIDYLNTSNNAIGSLQYENAQLRKENKRLKERNDELEDELEESSTFIIEQREENKQLRLELETHKNPLWSTREAERRVNKLSDSLADEVKKNGLLNEELNQLRIENERLKSRNNYNLEDCLLEIVELKEEKEQLKKKLESLQKVLHLVECVSDE